MVRLCCFIYFIAIFGGISARSITIEASHSNTFAVNDFNEKKYIKLSDEFEQHLGLINPTVPPGAIDDGDSGASFNFLTSNDDDDAENEDDDEDFDEDFEDNEDDDDDDDDDDDYDNGVEYPDFATDAVGALPAEGPVIPRDVKRGRDVTDDDMIIDRLSRVRPNRKRGRDVIDDDMIIDRMSRTRTRRRRRSAANEQWRSALPGGKPIQRDEEPELFETVTDTDLMKAQRHKYRQLAKHVGITLLSVIFFVFIGISFIRDPKGCILSFGTCCPCCIICCPCIRSFTDKYLNPKNIVRDAMNKYMPGIIVKDDGTLDHYPPTTEEIEIMQEILEDLLERGNG